MFLIQAQSVIKVLVTMFSWLIKTKMLKQNRIISFISFVICLNLYESRNLAKLLLTSQPSNTGVNLAFRLHKHMKNTL